MFRTVGQPERELGYGLGESGAAVGVLRLEVRAWIVARKYVCVALIPDCQPDIYMRGIG